MALRDAVALSRRGVEPHVPCDRLDDGTWVYAPYGRMMVSADGARVVCHACGEPLTAISRGHVARHDLDVAGYRERFGLNRKQSLIAPALAQTRRVEGRRRYEANDQVRDGLAVGQDVAQAGALHSLGAAAQPAGSRRRQGREPASRDGASPSLRAHRTKLSQAARVRWEAVVQRLGFDDLVAYLAARRPDGSTAHRVRREMGCGGSVAKRLLESATPGPCLPSRDSSTPHSGGEGPRPSAVEDETTDDGCPCRACLLDVSGSESS